MSNISLYALAAEYRGDLEKLAELDLPDDVIADTLESLGGELEVKAQNVVAFSRHLEKLAESIKEAEAEMAKRRKAVEARAERIKAYVLQAMQDNRIQKIECPWFVLSIAKNPPAVEIEDERMVPKDYFTSPPPPPPQIDKKLILQALKDGYDVPGAKLRQGVRLAVR
ncbi:siphovirus Gp157 family protein [Pigmentiphaga soli]|uniref:Siphovirus Gp157 family protein n=1 Tax=Pigmentiphaga soli TaxID=1007095 RepID=A0ABP8GDC6_9BURK